MVRLERKNNTTKEITDLNQCNANLR